MKDFFTRGPHDHGIWPALYADHEWLFADEVLFLRTADHAFTTGDTMGPAVIPEGMNLWFRGTG
jgi:hypothetical protein